MFERAYIEISNICNLQCSFCPPVERDNKIISVENFRNYAVQIKPLTRQVCLHLMGEPLGHPQFQEILKICEELELKIFLTTNGTLLKRHMEALLSSNCIDQINFSVHSYFANPQKQTLEHYLGPILDFCDRSEKLNKDYYINLRLWNLDHPQAQKKNNLQIFDIIEKHYTINLNVNIDVKMNKSKKIQHKLYLHFDTEFIWPHPKQEIRSQQGSCYGLRKQVAIHANGDVVPCCLDKEAVLKLGSLHQNTLQEILKSDYATTIKTGFENGVLTQDLCQKCQYADRFKGKVNVAANANNSANSSVH